MAISDRTRKLLWGRSGNRCAICKNVLIVNATVADDESVIAEECHIISQKPKGPRYKKSYPEKLSDNYENLILLCRTHHKMIDDQVNTFSAEILHQIKKNHEGWVSDKLNAGNSPKPIRILPQKEQVPSKLVQKHTGQELLDLVTNVLGYSFNNEELKAQDEVDLVGNFLQDLEDWGEISGELESAGRVRAAYSLGNSLQKLRENGFYVFWINRNT